MVNLTGERHSGWRKHRTSSSDSVILGDFFFRKTSATEDVKLEYTPEKDFSDTYCDWALDEEVEVFRKANPDRYQDVVDRLDKWFTKHKFKTLNVLYAAFENRDIAFSSFKQLLHDLHVPASGFQQHLLCVLLDPAYKKCVNIRSLQCSLGDYHRMQLEVEGRLQAAQELVDDNIFIRMNLMNFSFLDALKHRGNFRVLLNHDTYVGALIDMIHARVPLIHRDLHFHASIKSAKCGGQPVPLSCTLKEAGLLGGPLHQPTEHFLFYIVKLEISVSPLLTYKPHESEKREKKLLKQSDSRTKGNWWESKKRPPVRERTLPTNI